MYKDYLKDNEGKPWLESYEETIKNINLGEYKAIFQANPNNTHSNPFQNEMMCKVMYYGLYFEEQL